jgi:hypothetical protein
MINMPYFLREKLHYPRGVVRDNGYWEIETDDLPLDPAGWVGEECRVYNINGGNIKVATIDIIQQPLQAVLLLQSCLQLQ